MIAFCVLLYRQTPSLLEYLSYNFCFLCFLAGPACTYKEYQDFITGSNFTSAKLENPNQLSEVSTDKDGSKCNPCLFYCTLG